MKVLVSSDANPHLSEWFTSIVGSKIIWLSYAVRIRVSQSQTKVPGLLDYRAEVGIAL